MNSRKITHSILSAILAVCTVCMLEAAAPNLNRVGAADFSSPADIEWFSGRVNSHLSGSGSIAQNAAGYTYSQIIVLPSAGTEIAFAVDSAAGTAGERAYVFSVWREGEERAAAGVAGNDRSVFTDGGSEDVPIRYYRYVSSEDGERVRLCYRSGALGGALPENPPQITIRTTGGQGTLERILGEAFCGIGALVNVGWASGCIGSGANSENPNTYIYRAVDHMTSEEFTVENAGTEVCWSSPPISQEVYAVTIRIFKDGEWISDPRCTGIDGSARIIAESDGRAGRVIYSYTTSCDGEKLRVTAALSSEELVYPAVSVRSSQGEGTLSRAVDVGCSGAVGSSDNSGYPNGIDFSADDMRLSGIIRIPSAGTVISFVSPYTIWEGYAVFSLMTSDGRGGYTIDADNAPPTPIAKSEQDGKSVRYSYVTRTDGELLMISAPAECTASPLIISLADLADRLAVTTRNQASVRMTLERTTSGLRFVSEIDREAFDILVSAVGRENIRVGTVITPRQFAQEAGGCSEDKLAKLEKNNKYLDIVAKDWYNSDNGLYLFSGSVVNIFEKHYRLEYAAAGYVRVTVGDVVLTVCSEVTAVRSVAYTAGAALGDLSENPEGAYIYSDGNGKYGKYNEIQREILSAYAAAEGEESL